MPSVSRRRKSLFQRHQTEGLEERALLSADVQLFHNSPYAGAEEVDVYVNGGLAIDSFAFRSATEFLELPSETPLTLQVAAGDSSSAADSFFTARGVVLADGSTYVIQAVGNPAPGAAIDPFGLEIADYGQQQSGSASNVDVLVFHGSPDAPNVDVDERDLGELLPNIAYREFAPAGSYASLPAASYILDITAAGDDSVVASYAADLSTLGGGAAVVAASGFLSPSGDQPAFGLFAALPDGTVIELPGLARVQVVHNSPYDIASEVDVYIDDVLTLDNFAFRTATPFIDFPVGAEVAIATADSTSSADAVFRTVPPVTNAGTFVAIATGDPLANPADPTAFRLEYAAGQESAADSSLVDLLVFHGSPDAPGVDVFARGLPDPLVPGLDFGEFDDAYLSVPPATYTLDITPAGVPDIVASFEARLDGAAGASAVVAASGFLAGDADQPGFGLLAVFPDGTTALLPVLITTSRRDGFVSARQAPGDPDTWQIRTRRQSFDVSASSTGEVVIDGEGIRRFELQVPGDGSDLPELTFRGDASKWLFASVVGSAESDNIVMTGTRSKLSVSANGASASLTNVDLGIASGREGNDVIDASGVDQLKLRLYGGHGDDVLIGGSADDVLFGGRGDDALIGGDGRDRLFGGWGNDLLVGNAGNDLLFGSFGNDVLLGGDGRDFLNGGFGHDSLAGGRGRDLMIRGRRVDLLFGDNVDRELKARRLDALWESSIDVDDLLDAIFGPELVS